MGPVALYLALRRKPDPNFRPLVNRHMTLDSGAGRNDVLGIMLFPDIFEHRLLARLAGVCI